MNRRNVRQLDQTMSPNDRTEVIPSAEGERSLVATK